MSIKSETKDTTLEDKLLEATKAYITQEIDKLLEEQKKTIEQKINDIRDTAITRAGITIAKYVDYQQMHDRIVITLHKEK